MGATPFRRVDVKTTLIASLVALFLGAAMPSAAEPLRDVPVVWYEDDSADVTTEVSERDPNLTWDYFNEAVARPFGYYTDPARFVRRLSVPFGGERDKASPNVNTLGEVPNSSWFTNRIALFGMSPADAARGPGRGDGPSRDGAWTIVGAKTQGVTPGFTIRDAEGGLYLIKFDPPQYPGMASGAGVISARLLHAAGYHVPEDEVVYLHPSDLVLGEGVRLTLPSGAKRPMTEQDVQDILARVHREDDGSYRAISSHFLSGRPLGPFDYKGKRKDDPNDRIKHHHRRELRGLEVFAAWINHFDTKQHNSLDMLVEEDGRRFVKHYLIDFASTLGTGADGPSQRFGWEGTLDPKAFLRRTLTLGFVEDDWRKTKRVEGLDEVAFFENEHFDPLGFEPIQPNPAFQRIHTLDGYWAAKIISSIRDEHLEAIVVEARYRNPAASDYMVRTLAGRRDSIARAWFDKVAPLEYFQARDGEVVYRDLGAERNIYPGTTPRYRTRVAAVDADRDAYQWTDWREGEATRASLDAPAVSAESHPFFAVECQVDRGEGWSGSIRAFVSRANWRVIAVERSKS